LAEAYVKLWPEEDQFLQVQRIEQLSLSNKKHPVGRLVAADFNIRAKLWGPARKHLDVFMSRMPTTRKAARLMAEFEEGANKDHASANTWLRNVETAEPDARWICTKCGAQPGEWHATCPTCGRFATYEWLTPGYTLEEEMAKEAGELKDNDKS
jgi:HemY protein